MGDPFEGLFDSGDVLERVAVDITAQARRLQIKVLRQAAHVKRVRAVGDVFQDEAAVGLDRRGLHSDRQRVERLQRDLQAAEVHLRVSLSGARSRRTFHADAASDFAARRRLQGDALDVHASDLERLESVVLFSVIPQLRHEGVGARRNIAYLEGALRQVDTRLPLEVGPPDLPSDQRNVYADS